MGAAELLQADRVASLLERTPTIRDADLTEAQVFGADPGLEVLAVLGRHGRAVCVLRRQQRVGDAPGDLQVLPISLRATVDAYLPEVATRAMTRPTDTRFDPVACGDAYGGYLGIVRPERMMLRLAELESQAGRVDVRPGGLRLVPAVPEPT